MKNSLFILSLVLFSLGSRAQYKSYDLSIKGDTINAIDKAGAKQGKWVERYDEVRGEPGYEEEGEYKDGKKEGYWRLFTLEGDLIAIENYYKGGKDGAQLYYQPSGELLRSESWRAYNPESPYDTVYIYGSGNNEIVGTKLVKAVQYSVKHGDWKYYDPSKGTVVRTVKYELNREIVPKEEPVAAQTGKKKEVKKTAEMLEWELKNKGKKGAIRDGATGY